MKNYNTKKKSQQNVQLSNMPAPAHLPDSMIDSVHLLPKNKKLLLFTRHSLRERSDGQGFTSNQLPLTPKGRVLASSWGRWLESNLDYCMDIDAISSPIQRCVDTALLMQESTGINKEVIKNSLLVEPGSLVIDSEVASPLFKDIGALSFINLFLQDNIAGTKKSHHGCLDFLYLFYSNQPSSSQLRLVVSHDTLLSAFLYVVMDRKEICWNDWPKMMEGIFLWFDDKPFTESTLHYIWRGELQQLKISNIIERYIENHDVTQGTPNYLL